jgi:hypothetical protein
VINEPPHRTETHPDTAVTCDDDLLQPPEENMTNKFTIQKATREQMKARLAFLGPTGGGKTYTGLAIMTALCERVVVIDTENRRASLYSDVFDFDTLPLSPPYSPAVYTDALHHCEGAGYDGILIDGISQAWDGEGGALEMVDAASKRSSGNSYVAWRDVTPVHNKMINAFINCQAHLGVTVRTKMEHVQEKDSNGRTQIRKVGMAPIQRQGLEFEFDVVADLDTDHNMIISKTRCSALDGKVYNKAGAEVADVLRGWLDEGDPMITVDQDTAIRERIAALGLTPDEVVTRLFESYKCDRLRLLKRDEASAFIDELTTE